MYQVLFLEKNGNVFGVGAVLGDGSKWFREYGDKSKDYPRPIIYQERDRALNHAKRVVTWLKRNDKDLFNRVMSYQIVKVYEAEQS